MSFFLLYLFFSGAPALAAGGAVGNGGDIIFCRPSAKNSLQGPYTLDFVAGYDGSPVPQDADSLSALATNLFEKGKRDEEFWRMSRSLANFLLLAKEQVFHSTDYAAYYVWISEKQGLVDIDDSSLIERVPENCQTVTDKGPVLNLTQAVIRRPNPQGVVLHYDPQALRQLLDSSPYQFSYLLIHEWLRGLTNDAQTIRDLNRLLHSRAFASASVEEAKVMMQRVSGMNEFPFPRGEKQVFITVETLNAPPVKRLSAIAGTWVQLNLKFKTGGYVSCTRAPSGKAPSTEDNAWVWPCDSAPLQAGEVLWIKDKQVQPNPVPLVEVESLAPDFRF